MDLFNQIKASQFQSDVLKNASIDTAGYERAITTMTGIKKKITEQKFYTLGEDLTPSSFVPMTIGDNAFAEDILVWTSFDIGDDFEAGNIDTATGNTKLSNVETALSSVNVKVVTWAKEIGYSIVDVAKAQRSAGQAGWSKIASLEKARKRNWDLGIQRVAFLGSRTDTAVRGLLNQTGVSSNTMIITQSLSSMSAAQFTEVIRQLVADYFARTNSTQMPSHFVIPYSDWLGLGVPYNSSFPTYTRRDFIHDELKKVTRNADFKMLPLSYSDTENNNLGVTRYALYNYDDTSGEMQIPVPYTTTLIDTNNGFFYKSVAYGQYTGFNVYRPLEFRYYDF